MYQFKIHNADNLSTAVDLFNASDEPVYIAGGHTLIPTMKQRLSAPSDVIDLAKIPGLDAITQAGDVLQIGAMATHSKVTASSLVQEHCAALASLAGGIGDRQVRNRGTIGGSLANNDPAADYPAAVLGLNAEIVTDRRTITAEAFFKAMFETALEPDEIIQAVHFPQAQQAVYLKFPNPASRYAMVGVMLTRTAGEVRVAITGAAASVFRAAAFEEALTREFGLSAIEAVNVSAETLNADMHASAEYRAHLCKVLIKRGVEALSA
jgi:aerobic carbon-monoxide dehydrogenase medium subunit